jgi:hypothetical protein
MVAGPQVEALDVGLLVALRRVQEPGSIERERRLVVVPWPVADVARRSHDLEAVG